MGKELATKMQMSSVLVWVIVNHMQSNQVRFFPLYALVCVWVITTPGCSGKPLASSTSLPTELSTIIEADTSGLSKNIPSVRSNKSSHQTDPEFSLPTPPDSDQPNVSLLSLNLASALEEQSPNEVDDSVLDLSTSELQIEVQEALSANGYNRASGWLDEGTLGVVDDAELDDQRHGSSLAGDPNISLNLGALDPDLAELLAVPHITTSKSLDLTPTASPVSPKDAGFATSQSSPARPSFLTPAASRIPSSSSLPRLRAAAAASALSTPSTANKDLPLLPPVPIYPDTPSSDNVPRQGSLDSIRARPSPPLAPPSPPNPASRPNATWSTPFRRPSSSSRTIAPMRHASYTSATSKPSRIRSSLVSTPPIIDSAPHSPTLPPTVPSTPAPGQTSGSASLGSTAANRLLSQARASLDDVSRIEAGVGLGPSMERYRPSLLRSRKRSMSLEAQRSGVHPAPSAASSSQHGGARTSYVRPASSLSSSARPVTDWLGPRTAKVFAAAGLIESSDDASTMRSTSRLGLARTGSERTSRVQQIQQRAASSSSRITLSEASGSNSSWGRSGSVSQTMGTSEALVEAHTHSPTYSISRTNFSGSPSTAPTSVSAFSAVSTHQQLQSTIQTMKERHEVETEALLAALSDSQQTSRVLRVENNELRGRMQRLEEQLEEARMLALRCQTTHAHLLVPQSRSLDSRSRANSTDDGMRLPHSASSFNSSSNTTFARKHERYDSISRATGPSTATSAYDIPSSKALKRISTTSSIFPVPPSNMTMLMTEEGLAAPGGAPSSRSVSPQHPLSTAMRINGRHGHGHRRSMSNGNVSPTTANFSMTEMTGSPGSLCLRPEHEMHLGDMVTLDLGYGTGDGDDF